jgi:hypothetical protein
VKLLQKIHPDAFWAIHRGRLCVHVFDETGKKEEEIWNYVKRAEFGFVQDQCSCPEAAQSGTCAHMEMVNSPIEFTVNDADILDHVLKFKHDPLEATKQCIGVADWKDMLICFIFGERKITLKSFPK